VPQWTADGVAGCASAYDQQSPVLVSDGAGGAIITWEDWRAGNGSYVYAQRLSASGAGLWLPDGVTSTLVSLVSATAGPGWVRLEWNTPGRGIAQTTLYRQGAQHEWSPLATLTADGTGGLSYEDRDVQPGTRYGYRLGILAGGIEEFLGETWVQVPGEFTFALEGARPNPAVEELAAVFTLAKADAARLDLLDPSGRRLRSWPLRGLGAGNHVLPSGRGSTSCGLRRAKRASRAG